MLSNILDKFSCFKTCLLKSREIKALRAFMSFFHVFKYLVLQLSFTSFVPRETFINLIVMEDNYMLEIVLTIPVASFLRELYNKVEEVAKLHAYNNIHLTTTSRENLTKAYKELIEMYSNSSRLQVALSTFFKEIEIKKNEDFHRHSNMEKHKQIQFEITEIIDRMKNRSATS